MAGPAGKKTAALVRPCLNTLLMMDVMSGSYIRGKDGVWYLNGGLHAITGYAGRGNTFKTAFSSFNVITACIRYNCEYTEIYDTEMSYQISRANTFARLVPGAGHIDFNDKILDGSFNIVSSIELPGDEWWKVICDEYDKRRKIKGGLRETPFYDFDGSVIKMLDPWLYLVDSMTMLKTSNIAELEDKNVVGASTLQTMAMRSAGAKSQLISQMPIVTGGAGIYLSMVAHAGDGIKLDQYSPSQKKLSGLKGDIKLKGVPENFTFLTNNCFIATASKAMLDGKKMPEYRRRQDDNVIMGDTDLMIVRFEQLRGKGGPTGRCLDLIFSQAEGLQATLSEFYHLNKIVDSFGIEVIGNNAKFRLHLYPEVTFTRNSIRELISTDPKFCRAMELTFELANLTYNNPWQFKDIMLDCEQLKAGIEAQGIEWDKILTDTVYYWYLADQKYRECTMTIPTLLEIAAGLHKDKRLAKIKPLAEKKAA